MLGDVLTCSPTAISLLLLSAFLVLFICRNYINHEDLRSIPGPRTFALCRWRLAYEDWSARRVRTIKALHDRYGPVVRVGPREISFNSLTALRTIYGAGNGFERTSFYRMFDVYDCQNLFTFGPVKDHRERKKLLSHAYSNQVVLENVTSHLVQSKVSQYMRLLEQEMETTREIFTSLHYFSLDAISEFVYGPDHGGTKALTGSVRDRALLNDILDPTRRKLAWFAVHFPNYTRWIISQKGLMDRLVDKLGLLPMKKPTTYTGIRLHALKAANDFRAASPLMKARVAESTVIGRLNKVQEEAGLSDLDIASECADHLLAGIDTTADSLMFLVWALSLPKHAHFQSKICHEVSQLPLDLELGVPSPKDASQLPYLNAVIKETLRLYAPLPATEPRSSPVDTVIDGYKIPAGTIVGMAPYCLHRNAEVFPDPLSFNPERWLAEKRSIDGEADDMNRWFWAFSSGGRMCIGMHLAMSEMVTLVAAVYGKYQTKARKGEENATPGITSRFEVFYDESSEKIVEHECWIDFTPLA